MSKNIQDKLNFRMENVYARNKNVLMQQHLPKNGKASLYSTEQQNTEISQYTAALTGRGNIQYIPGTDDVEQCKDVPTHFL